MMEKRRVLCVLYLLPLLMIPVIAESEQSHNESRKLSVTRNKIMTAQYECYQKIIQDPIQHTEGLYCNRTWDGWLCWSYGLAGTESVQHCPDYFQDFDPSEKVTKICDQDGHWFRHPDSNRTWTDYTRCNTNTHERLQTALNLFYLAIIGHGLSIASLLISLGIFFYFKSLSCQRITLHKNLFFSFVCNSVITIIHLTAVANNQALVATDPVGCKVSQFLHLYLMGCNYFWMLCEGVYLHTLIVVAVFAEKQRLLWYHVLGWGFPLIPACTHAVGRSLYYNDKCWISSDTHLLYIIHGPICAALLVGSGSPALTRGLLVSTIFCFFNGEVQAILRRNWNQYKIQFGSSFSHSDALRSASYTVSTISDGTAYSHDFSSEHSNGKSIENVILKPEKLNDYILP
ncbi:PREDICTED: calcitonin gene-related peptide type 1 receptor [Myotis davidii]|uniref:calcitonin gene-related peptide type 1 receptor n=1 Tax=Myotis davidii TaxID=225400 RepID=UPI0007678CF0|nr:PREDICTED: calcitonin gene-related peptide type 1 receptor [Myotis davidii]